MYAVVVAYNHNYELSDYISMCEEYSIIHQRQI